MQIFLKRALVEKFPGNDQLTADMLNTYGLSPSGRGRYDSDNFEPSTAGYRVMFRQTDAYHGQVCIMGPRNEEQENGLPVHGTTSYALTKSLLMHTFAEDVEGGCAGISLLPQFRESMREDDMKKAA